MGNFFKRCERIISSTEVGVASITWSLATLLFASRTIGIITKSEIISSIITIVAWSLAFFIRKKLSSTRYNAMTTRKDIHKFRTELGELMKSHNVTNAVILFEINREYTGTSQYTREIPPNPFFTNLFQQTNQQLIKEHQRQNN
jgi:hypothetical protein